MAFQTKYVRAKEFEALMMVMKRRAMVAAAAHKISRYLGIFGLTWATVVVLGGFAQYLNTIDIIMVGTLLLFQAIRFAASSTFSRLPSANLFTEQLHPNEFTHRDDQYYWASRMHSAGQIWSSVISFLAIASTSFRMSIPRGHISLAAYAGIRNIVRCLLTFYVFTILTSVFALIAVILHFTRFFPCSSIQSPHLHETSTTAFYDAVYHRAIESDLYSSFGISLLEFAFDKLRSDHVRGIQPLAIEAYNRSLVHYLYDVPTGIEMAYQHLQDPDMYRQLVSVNLAMFWAGKKRIEMQIAYFAELGRKLERPEKMAEAATYAIERLADSWADYPPDWLPVNSQPLESGQNENGAPKDIVLEMAKFDLRSHKKPYPGLHPFLESKIDPVSESNTTVVDMLARLVIRPLRSSLVFQVRALESCCRSREVVEWIQAKDYYEDLKSKLLSIVDVEGKLGMVAGAGNERERPRQRTKIYAASALFHLSRSQAAAIDRLSEDGKESCNNNNSLDLDPLRDGKERCNNNNSYCVDLGTKEWKELLQGIDPADPTERYVWKKETQLLDSLRQAVGLAPFDGWDKVQVKDPADPTTLHS